MKPASNDPDPDQVDLIAFMESSLIESLSYGLRNVLTGLIRKGWSDERILQVVRSELGRDSDKGYAIKLYLHQQRIVTVRTVAG